MMVNWKQNGGEWWWNGGGMEAEWWWNGGEIEVKKIKVEYWQNDGKMDENDGEVGINFDEITLDFSCILSGKWLGWEFSYISSGN